MKTKPQYLDNAATPPVDTRVKEAMLPYFDEIFGNAISNHVCGKEVEEVWSKNLTLWITKKYHQG